jgi:hypothetical protein
MKDEMTDFVGYREPLSPFFPYCFLYKNSSGQSIPPAEEGTVERLYISLHDQEA